MNVSAIKGLGGSALTGGLLIAGAMALSSPSRAAVVDEILHLTLDGMSTGLCAGMSCPISFGTVTVTGDTTSTLDFAVALAPDVNFYAGASGTGDAFWLDLSAMGNPITFTLDAPTSGTISGQPWSWVTPFSIGSFTPAPGTDFPGPYADVVQCMTAAAGDLCGAELNFTASGADATHPFHIGDPPGAGPFLGIPVPFVANLSVAPHTTLCPESDACTGLVGAPEPSTWTMMRVGFAALGYGAFRQSRRSHSRDPSA